MSHHSSSSSPSRDLQQRASLFIDEGVIEPPQMAGSADNNDDHNGSGLSVIIDDTRADILSTGTLNTSGMDTPEDSSSNDSSSSAQRDNNHNTVRQDLSLAQSSLHDYSSPLANKSIRPQTSSGLHSRDDSSANTVSTSALGGDTSNLTRNAPADHINSRDSGVPLDHSGISLDPMVLNDFDALLGSTPLHHTSDRHDQRHSRPLSSLYQYDETIEPDIEEAVKLLKREMRVDSARITRITEGELEAVVDATVDADVSRQSVEFKPQAFHLMSKSSVITEPPPSPGMVHAPRSPSLINKFIVNNVSEEEGTDKHAHNSRQSGFDPATFLALASSESHSPNKNVNRLSGGIPKIPVLRRVSGPSKWARTTSLTDSAGVTPIKVSTMSPLRRTQQPQGLLNSSTAQGTQLAFNRQSDGNTHTAIQPIPETQSLASPAESVAHHHLSNTHINNNIQEPSTALSENAHLVNLPQQRLNNSSVESFDSRELKFSDIYSLQRILLTIAACIVCPAAFFMIGAGSRAGINDYRLMRLILNREHRIGLLKGFIWDVRVNWFRHLCLALGVFEFMAIGVCIGVGFGVGLRNERRT